MSQAVPTQADSSPGKRCPKCSNLHTDIRELGNFGGGPVGCQKVTAFRLVSGLSQPILLFKYQVEATTQVSKHEPRHLGATHCKQSTWISQVCMHMHQTRAIKAARRMHLLCLGAYTSSRPKLQTGDIFCDVFALC